MVFINYFRIFCSIFFRATSSLGNPRDIDDENPDHQMGPAGPKGRDSAGEA